jgi:hypothetical protein
LLYTPEQKKFAFYTDVFSSGDNMEDGHDNYNSCSFKALIAKKLCVIFFCQLFISYYFVTVLLV